MVLLRDIIGGIKSIQTIGNVDVEITAIAIDSRKVEAGSAFIAISGSIVDGHNYIDNAITGGAIVIVCEKLPKEIKEGVTYIQVENCHVAAGLMASAFYGFPSEKMKVVGITGTNGKTTCATLLYELFEQLGKKCGLISTVKNHIHDQIEISTHTTPDPIALQHLLKRMLDAGCSHVFMEVSSHAIHQHRIEGIAFSGGIFTNITHDHLDYHQTFDEYIRVKKSFFDDLNEKAFALTNIDDKRGAVMLQNTKAEKCTYSLRSPATFFGKILENNLTGLVMTIDGMETHFRMIGTFNAYNLLAVYGAAVKLGEDKMQVLAALSGLHGAAGRFETYYSPVDKILGIIDYAHTPDALLNVLSTISQLRGGVQNIITVIGCGGDRDKAKRPVMAEVACEQSDKVILTSDNPRSEDPEVILDEMEQNLTYSQKRKILRITDRKEAIKTACTLAQPGDIILVGGKGHETYQESKGNRIHFDDREVLQESFKLLNR